MLDNNNKELDKLFQSKLQNNEAAENKWNIPPMDVFENALSEMEVEEPEKKRRWPIFFFISFGFLMLSSVGYLFYQNQSMMVELDKKIEVLNQAQAAAQKDKTNEIAAITDITEKEVISDSQGNIGNNSIAKTNIPINETSIINSSLNSIGKNEFSNNTTVSSKKVARSIIDTNRGRSINSTPATPIAITNSIQVTEAKTTTIPVKKYLDKGFASNLNNTNTTINKQSFELTNSIPTLSFQLLNDLDNLLPILPIVYDDSNEKAIYKGKEHSNKIAPYLLVGLHTSKFKTDFTMDATVTNEVSVGQQIGFGIVQQLSDRWSLDYSIGYKSFSTVSNYLCNLSYDKSEEGYNNNGELVYRMNMGAVNPLYNTIENIEMKVAQDEMADGDIFINNIETNLAFNLISANVGVRYKAVSFGKFDLYLNGGIGVNSLLKIKDEMKMQVIYLDEVKMDKTATHDISTVDRGLFFSGYTGLQLDYKLTERIKIGLNNNYEHVFNSLYVNPNVSNGSSKLNSINSTIRVGYEF